MGYHKSVVARTEVQERSVTSHSTVPIPVPVIKVKLRGMKTIRKQPNWYTSFQAWIAQPCAEGEWLYRGQATKYASITPSLLREKPKSVPRRALYQLSLHIADKIFQMSPVFRSKGLHPELTEDPTEIKLIQIGTQLTGQPLFDHVISSPEVLRALAQHYGFPTQFVDLTLNPMVAAFFATHVHVNDTYYVSVEPGTIFRWPARRLSKARLFISLDSDNEDFSIDAIPAIDLSSINKYLRRPKNQEAVLATPSRDPLQYFRVHPSFSASPEELDMIDMARLSSCQKFELPPSCGHEIEESDGVTTDGLFPDLIDPGYSYLSVIALMSIILHDPDDPEYAWLKNHPRDSSLIEQLNSGILASHIILDRECLRLIPRCPINDIFRKYPLSDAEHIVTVLSETAIRAAGLLGLSTTAEEKMQQDAKDEIFRRLDTLRSSPLNPVRNLNDLMGFINLARGEVYGSEEIEWIRPEIQRRVSRVQEIINFAEYVPPYALQKPASYSQFIEALESDENYEKMINKQIHAHNIWKGSEDPFPPFDGPTIETPF